MIVTVIRNDKICRWRDFAYTRTLYKIRNIYYLTIIIKRDLKRLLVIVTFSFVIAVMAFTVAGVVGSGLLPYQDPTPELLEKHTDYVNAYTPIWYLLMVTFFISFVIFLINSTKLIIMVIKDKK